MSGHRTCAGYEYYGERVSSTPTLHHSKSPHQDPRLTESDRHLWPVERRNRTYSHSGVIDEVGGSNHHTERMLDARKRTQLQLLNMDGKNPLFLLQPVTKSDRIFSSTAHLCDSKWHGTLLSRISHACFATTGYGATTPF